MIPFHPSKQDDQPGATLRDWFAGMAMQAILSNDSSFEAAAKAAADQKIDGGLALAKIAYSYADYMLAARGDKHVEVAP